MHCAIHSLDVESLWMANWMQKHDVVISIELAHDSLFTGKNRIKINEFNKQIGIYLKELRK